ncbi:hypothetical protein PHYBOEH_003857 [Phytophthora boehmeriae]|uniref:HTH CENPB-type domain-containing protein n=1 Tax=Phytophthora boehmeriae TaxID=109152 RepID=A0A8T1X5A4_9STRA|nr:hypothetical protein PHYBOEH_003857 [Phytophthora boehmeriae]
MEAVAAKDTRAHLTLEQKAQLRAFLAANPNLPQFAVTDWVREHFHVRLGRSTLYRIQRAPESAFTSGNLRRKKLRRVKFPEFEQFLLKFYKERRHLKLEISDDELLRKAAECRASCGISDSDLKLSNGWLYRFKIRHQLGNVSPQEIATQDRNRQQTATATQTQPADSSQGPTERSGTTSNAVVLSARALTTVQAPGFLNWEPTGEFQQEHVMLVNDGVVVTHAGVFEVNIRMEHSASLQSECVFKVYWGDRVVGEGITSAHVLNDVASSVVVVSCLRVEAPTVLRVEFLAAGYAFTDSRLVVRLEGAEAH